MKTAEKIISKLNETEIADQHELSRFLRRLYGELKMSPMSKATLIEAYRQMVKDKRLEKNIRLEQLLIKRAVRTLSGVTVVTVLTKPYVCPGKCVYCPTEPNMPKSYLSNEPAAQRAVRNKFDPFDQMAMRIRALENNGHPVDKIEIIVLGGTWSSYTKEYQDEFIQQLFYSANIYGQKKRQIKSLAEEQKINETAKYRIIGLTLETRPDHIDADEIKRLRNLGCTRVQLGVQHTDNKILEYIRRGDTIEMAIEATRQLKEAGFKVDHHYMPDLPGSTPEKDLEMFKQVYFGGELSPDQVKIYPCVVNEYAQLWHWYKNGKYKPYEEKELYDLLMEIKRLTPEWVRINRLIRDIPEESIIAGNSVTNLRQYLQQEIAKNGEYCKCIRCREARASTKDANSAVLKKREYTASKGKEVFLSYESEDDKKIFAFLRLRFNAKPEENVLAELKGASLVRELHVYGQMIPVNQKTKGQAQHVGFGKRLMAEAEKLTKEEGLEKIAVISGIGVREYYKKLGYSLEGTYMVKYLT